jgi:hypothetical protein
MANSPHASENSEHWSAWESVGLAQSNSLRDFFPFDLAPILNRFGVSYLAFPKWLDVNNGLMAKPGDVCLCGHPTEIHDEDRFCMVNPAICTCQKAQRILWASDLRNFYCVTKGPHEAHALSRGLINLKVNGGSFSLLDSWCCSDPGCRSLETVGPSRVKPGGMPTIHLQIHDKTTLLCEQCLLSRSRR